MANAHELKQRIDCADLAERLGMEKPAGQPNFKSPNRKDDKPSVSMFRHKQLGISYFKDHATGEHGSCIDLVMYVLGCDESDAMRELHEIYSIAFDKKTGEAPKKKSKMEWVAEQCLANPAPAREYLVNERGLPEKVVDYFIKCRTVGYNDWTNPEKTEGEQGWCGPSACFISRSVHDRSVLGIENRFFYADKNGGQKTKSQGEKENAPYIPDLSALKRAEKVIVCEAPINALSAIAAFDEHGKGLGKVTAIATRGTAVVESIDWSLLSGKTAIICMDNDQPNERGNRPGPEAAWKVLEQLTALNIPAHLVEQSDWPEEVNDINDYLKANGIGATRTALKRLEANLIQGFKGREPADTPWYNRRLYLPNHDFEVYWRFKTKPDFSTYINVVTDPETKEQRDVPQDLAGFRVAALSRISIASAASAMTGDTDSQPTTVFSVSVQTPRHKDKLLRRVLLDDQLHNVEQWKKFGPVFKPSNFARMLNILERGVDIGSCDAVNFVGLAWRDGRPIVNEGPDCYFTDPKAQCPYHGLKFPSGPAADAEKVINAYQETFKDNAALLLLVWGVGCHLKAFLGTWPHMMLQADKGAGKSTLIKRLERSIAFTMFSGQSLKTEFRLLTSISHTSHPVGWEELSANSSTIINKAVALLQENYQYTTTRRGSDMMEYLVVAPVLLAGEDVPVDSLQGKMVRTDLSGRRGPMMPEDLPAFPVRQWLQYLARMTKAQVQSAYKTSLAFCEQHCSCDMEDNGASRIRNNYAHLLTAWMFLCEFVQIPQNLGDFKRTLITEMNSHINETSAARLPWVWIMELILGEIDSHNFRHPYEFGVVEEKLCLCIRSSHIMQHLSQSPNLRTKFDALPVKSDRVLKKQLISHEVVVKESVERTVKGKRISAMLAIGLDELAAYGLSVAVPDSANGNKETEAVA